MSAPLTRRSLVGAGATAAAVTALGAPARAAADPAETADVVVVGAGLAGLQAAHDVRQAGASVLVLEARGRVGGRVLDRGTPGGAVVELGGQWVGPGQDAVLALARRLGVRTFPTFTRGQALYERAGALRRYAGAFPPLGPVALVEIGALLQQLDADAAGVPAAHPWQADRARELDTQTLATYLDRRCRTPEARAVADVLIRATLGEEPGAVSTLNFLANIAGAGGRVTALLDDAQQLRLTGGPARLARGLAQPLGDRVRLGHEVVAVERQPGHAEVVVRGGARVRARQVVVAVPLTLLDRLAIRPRLPAATAQLLQRSPTGCVIKLNAVYPRAFWRDDGLSGGVLSTDGPLEVVYDNSPPSGRPGVLVSFFEADHGRRLLAAPAGARRQEALACLRRWFGPRATEPTWFAEESWPGDDFSGGAYAAYQPPGAITSLGPALDAELDRLVIAGADVATRWQGYMDGALRSGADAAREVLGRL